MLESNLCDYSDALIAVQEALIVPKILKTAATPINRNTEVIFNIVHHSLIP